MRLVLAAIVLLGCDDGSHPKVLKSLKESCHVEALTGAEVLAHAPAKTVLKLSYMSTPQDVDAGRPVPSTRITFEIAYTDGRILCTPSYQTMTGWTQTTLRVAVQIRVTSDDGLFAQTLTADLVGGIPLSTSDNGVAVENAIGEARANTGTYRASLEYIRWGFQFGVAGYTNPVVEESQNGTTIAIGRLEAWP